MTRLLSMPTWFIMKKDKALFAKSELQIENEICHYLGLLSQRLPLAFWKMKIKGEPHVSKGKVFFKRSSNSGFPDLLVCLRSQFIGIEVKTDKGRQQENQLLNEAKIKRAEGVYFIARSVEDVDKVLSQFF